MAAAQKEKAANQILLGAAKSAGLNEPWRRQQRNRSLRAGCGPRSHFVFFLALSHKESWGVFFMADAMIKVSIMTMTASYREATFRVGWNKNKCGEVDSEGYAAR